ncbi:spore germination protein [Oceanobacillus polygoni]|uniref:Tetrahydromethanopterin S-methyltransferase subunit G n=1 Tax=Oceanobacillus polygoni TaxID=1235259 RepID=A0A9X0YQ85_9BACI|nr:spore germination protein [Oceanobacillus polygoni]MBP2076714.1 tetrahydromethanopterin S-methyltransferase subunit G [Oceanobacillus polygoni]
MRKRLKRSSKNIFPLKIDELEHLLMREFTNSPDLGFSKYEHQNKKIAVFFITYQVQPDKVENLLLTPLLESKKDWSNTSILNEIPLNSGKEYQLLEEILSGLIIGKVMIYLEDETAVVSYDFLNKEKRSLEGAETESVVIGPKVAFTESLVTNLNVMRWNIRTPDLAIEEITIGKRAPREVRLLYLKSLANETDVNTMRQRLEDLEVDQVEDINVLMQYIEDSSMSLFPQFHTTELPDRTSYAILKGKIAVLMENSPSALIAPSSFFSFFESTEDLYMRWNSGPPLRLIRFISMFISVVLTPMYVAAVTFHYEIIPTQLLISIGQSRAGVPFPPIFEALFLELMIELLREAGARLPTKVGQTIGIVGGVVVGTAAVQAGITSNILIIFITISALASFTAPSYQMGTTIRLLRFPMIVLAGILGLIGIMFGMCMLIIHLLKMTSLGRPYLSPIYPIHFEDFNKALFRLPQNFQHKRSVSLSLKDSIRFSKKKAQEKKDIDE